MASFKMMRFPNVLRLVLSVGAQRRQRIDISSVEWFGKLKCFEVSLSGSFSCSSFRSRIHITSYHIRGAWGTITSHLATLLS